MTIPAGAVRATLIGTLLLGVFSGAAINNIASAPLSLIADDFETTPAQITLVASASGFALACCMPVAGWLSVRWGSRRILVGAYTLLGLGCLLAGLAPSVWMLVLGRVAQGIGMSVVPPTVMHALPELIGRERRAKALGWWAVANGAGTAAGAPLGALIADTVGWRVMFTAFVPVCALLAVACCWLKADAEPQPPLDLKSAAVLTVALALLIAPPMASGVGLPGWVLAASGVVGAAAAVVFLWGLRRSSSPFVTPAFLRSPGFAVGSLGGAAQMFILGSLSVLIPLVVVEAYGYSIRVAGLLVLVATATMMLSAPMISSLAPTYGARRLILSGLGLGTVSIVAAAALLAHELAVWAALVSLLIVGLALGLLQSPSAIAVSAEPSSRGSGVGLFNSVRFSGAVVGVSWLSLAALVGASPSQALVATAAPVAIAGVLAAVLSRPWRVHGLGGRRATAHRL